VGRVRVTPLGLLLFALTLQGPLEMVAESKLAWPLGYADDTFLQGAPEPTMRAHQALTALTAPLGLHAEPALSKYAVYSEDVAAATAVADHLELQQDPKGLLATGTSIGNPVLQAACAGACSNPVCQLMEELQALPLADQDSSILPHRSLQRRVAPLPRGCPWQHVGHPGQQAESKAVDGLFAGPMREHEDRPLKEQITLPHGHGGLGLSHTGPIAGVATYLTAAATAHRAMHSNPEAFRPFDSPRGDVLCP
jgi:hypothetical protein